MTRATFSISLISAILTAASLYLTYATYTEQHYANQVIAELRERNSKLTRDLRLTEEALDKEGFENVGLRDKVRLMELNAQLAEDAKERKRL